MKYLITIILGILLTSNTYSQTNVTKMSYSTSTPVTISTTNKSGCVTKTSHLEKVKAEKTVVTYEDTKYKYIVTTNRVSDGHFSRPVVTTNRIQAVQLSDLNSKFNKKFSEINSSSVTGKLTKLQEGPTKPRVKVLGCVPERSPQYTKPIVRK